MVPLNEMLLPPPQQKKHQQIILNYHFLDGATNASLKPGQVRVSVSIPISKKVQGYEVHDVHFYLF